MSKFFFHIIFAALCNTVCYGQKHDFNWLIGYGDFTTTVPNRDGLLLNFDGNAVTAEVFEKEEWFFLTSLAYSDADGDLQLYSDGCAFYDEHGTLLINGDNIHQFSFCASSPADRTGYAATQGMLAFPTVDQDIVAVFYDEEYIGQDTIGAGTFGRHRLQRAFIDLKENVVISKKETVLDDFEGGIMSATKHSNGQDWWLMNLDFFSNEYKCLLLSDGEVQDTVSSFWGSKVKNKDAPQASFSSDGTQFARFNPDDDLHLFDFDRSTGQLSNFRLIDVPTIEGNGNAGGLAFSSSGRFLYVNDAVQIWQYDTWAQDIAASIVQVAEREPLNVGQEIFNIPIWTFFFKMALAPDCRIYLSSRNGVDRIYSIMYPDRKGLACEVVQNIQIPVWNSSTTPHYPNYRLDNGPFCDSTKTFPSNLMTTVSTAELVDDLPTRLQVFPNPTSDFFQLYIKNYTGVKQVDLVLHDLLGRVILSKQLTLSEGNTFDQINVSSLPSGIYIYSVFDERGRLLGSDRLMVE